MSFLTEFNRASREPPPPPPSRVRRRRPVPDVTGAAGVQQEARADDADGGGYTGDPYQDTDEELPPAPPVPFWPPPPDPVTSGPEPAGPDPDAAGRPARRGLFRRGRS